MNKRAWIYIWSVFAVAAILALQSGTQGVPGWRNPQVNWPTVELLFGLAVGAQLFKVEAPNHVLFYATPAFFFAGVLLLPPFPLFLLIVVPHLAEWVKERWAGGEYLSAWYLQPFNIAMFWVAARSAQGILAVLHPHMISDSSWELSATLLAAAVFVMLNHTMLGVALMLARGVPWSDSGILDGPTLLSDFVILCVGIVLAELWTLKPWFILPALAPIAFMYQALMIPRLKREAEMDGKTGLHNARHFSTLFSAELDRARRFDRPLAVIMADLDHLREINNTYGHLAGDAVLIGVANVLQSTVRDYDVAARFGGEEFALLLPEVDEDQARVLAERLRSIVESTLFPVNTAPVPLRATMSFGIACFPHDGRSVMDLLHGADKAVYAAKESGRNRVVCASDVPTVDPTPEGTPEQAQIATEVPERQSSPPENLDLDADRGQGAAPVMQMAFVSVVTLAGLAALILGALVSWAPSPLIIALLTGLGALAELLEVDLFGQGTVSVSVGIAFTAALLTGIEGLACVSAAIAAVHHLRQRRGRSQLHRAAFNWAVHVLAGSGTVVALSLYRLPLTPRNLTLLAPVTVLLAAAYFAVETGLIATAIALARGDSVSSTWRTHYRWLLPHYEVMCLMGLALSVTFTQLGPLGALILALPLLMMHYVQRQYVNQSRESVRALQRLNRDLVRAALHDHLTGLGNERGFQETLRREVQAASQRTVPMVLARINIDDFRAINEEIGRRHGDHVLEELAGILSADSVLHRSFRLVADDFAVILPNTRLEEAVQALGALRLRAPAWLGGATVSAGVALLETGDLDADVLNEQALRALNEAKRRGRNAIVSFEEIRDQTLVASWAQAQAVRRLLSERDIAIAFQPIWDIDSAAVIGYEALARPGSDYGLVGPQEAFDVAARIGRARELDALCREAILDRARGLPPDTRLFLNLAPESLEQGRLSGPALVQAVTAAGLRPNQIVLELTERSIVRPDTVVSEVQALRQYGFAFALDDTGAGNAGLAVLSHLQVDFVKIDRSVVNHADTDQSARAVLAGIYALAREMGAYVIAEGIETVQMLDLVQGMSRALSSPDARGGRGVQGYLLGAPRTKFLTPDELGAPVALRTFTPVGHHPAPRFSVASAVPEASAVGW